MGLTELYQRDPRADAYMMVQDDTVFCRGVREFLEAELWPSERAGMVSVYCPEPYERAERGWVQVPATDGLIGALTCIFPNAAGRAMLAHPAVVEHRLRGARRGLIDTDGAVGRWAAQAAMPVYYHSPSLAQHIGDASTVWPGAPNAGRRHSSNFTGEAFDARELHAPPFPPRQRDHRAMAGRQQPRRWSPASCRPPIAGRSPRSRSATSWTRNTRTRS